MLSIWTGPKFCCLVELTSDKILGPFKLKAFKDNKIKVAERLKFVLEWVENIVEKGEKCWLPAFSPFPTIFSKDFFFRSLKLGIVS